MTYLQYGDKKFKILEGYELNFSSREVSFSNITIDFTNKKMNDLPMKYQEVVVYKDNQKQFTGYVNTFDFQEMKKSKNEFRELELNLLSPYQMCTKKSVTINGTFEIRDIINKVFAPLIADGFVLKEFNVRDGIKTVNYLLETIENIMNDLSASLNIWWYIDQNKYIYINDIDYQLGLEPKLRLNKDTKIEGWLSIQPSIEAVNYANVINVKNARIYFESIYHNNENYYKPFLNVRNIKKGDSVDFLYPLDIAEDTLKRNYSSYIYQNRFDIDAFSITIKTSNGYIDASISIDNDGIYSITDNISFSDEDKKIFTLKRDEFFDNLIIGFTYNGEDGTVSRLSSTTALEYRTMKFINSQEISNNKGKITTSGVIEKNVDMNSRWFFLDDLITEVKGMMYNNSNQTNLLKLKFDKDKSIRVGDIIDVNLPDFLAKGTYIVTDIAYSKTQTQLWTISVRTTDVLENFIDLFRADKKQENIKQAETIVLSEYVEEKVFESHEVNEV